MVYIQCGCTILSMKNVLTSGKLLLDGKGGQEFQEHSKNCITCHLPIEGTVYLELAVVPPGHPCFICGINKSVATMLQSYKCQHSWHMACLTLPLSSMPLGDWKKALSCALPLNMC